MWIIPGAKAGEQGVDAPDGAEHTPPVRTLVAAILSITLGVLPVFLLGALAVQVRASLGFDETLLGLAVSVFFAASALGSVPAGRISEQLGAFRGMALAGLASVVSLAGVAALADNWMQLAALLAVAGLANAVAQPASNLALAQAIPTARQGLAFGVKQANGPAAALLAGVAVPGIALTIGWRWAFAGGLGVAVAFFAVAGRLPSQQRSAGSADQGRARIASGGVTPLVLLAAAAAFGNAAASALTAFYVESAVAGGYSPGAAGLAFAGGSVAAITARVAWGWLADVRGGDTLAGVVELLLCGAVGAGLLALSGSPLVLGLGTVAAFAAGWAWLGVLLFAVVARHPQTPASATGIVLAGLFLGGIAGPPGFGALVEAGSYPPAWLAAAGALVVAAGLTGSARTLDRRRLGRHALDGRSDRKAGPSG
jgi:MFS family permease